MPDGRNQLSRPEAYIRHTVHRSGIRCEKPERDTGARQCEYYAESIRTFLYGTEAREHGKTAVQRGESAGAGRVKTKGFVELSALRNLYKYSASFFTIQ